MFDRVFNMLQKSFFNNIDIEVDSVKGSGCRI